MSAPQTNIEKQKRRHIVPLIGIGLAALFGVFLILSWGFGEVIEADPVQRDQLPDAAAPAPVSDIPPDSAMPDQGADSPAPLDPAPLETPPPAPAGNAQPG